MEDSQVRQTGNIREEHESIVYQILKKHTNLMEVDQLDELKKEDDLFFTFLYGQEGEQTISLYYRKIPGYQSIVNYSGASQELKRKIAKNLLAVEKLIGSQYTTLLHPLNIHADAKGNVKFVHRGIRSVFPTEELTVPQLLSELKKIIILLFSASDFSEVQRMEWKKRIKGDSFLEAIYYAASIQDLRQVIESSPGPEKVQKKEVPKTEAPKKQLLTGILIGILAGMIVLYFIQIVPLTEAAEEQTDKEAALQDDIADLREENTELSDSIEQKDHLTSAYQNAMNGNPEEAVTLLESAVYLDEHAEQTLFEQYLILSTPESLEKAIQLREEDPTGVLEELRGLNNEAGRTAILSIESDLPEVMIEQAWINEEFEQVIDIFSGMEENDRASYVTAYSYIEQGNYEAAMQIGEELDNTNIQIASLELQIDDVNDNDDLDDDEKEEEIEALDEMIAELE